MTLNYRNQTNDTELKVTAESRQQKNQQSIRSGIRNPVKKDRGLTRSSYRAEKENYKSGN